MLEYCADRALLNLYCQDPFAITKYVGHSNVVTALLLQKIVRIASLVNITVKVRGYGAKCTKTPIFTVSDPNSRFRLNAETGDDWDVFLRKERLELADVSYALCPSYFRMKLSPVDLSIKALFSELALTARSFRDQPLNIALNLKELCVFCFPS